MVLAAFLVETVAPTKGGDFYHFNSLRALFNQRGLITQKFIYTKVL